MEQQTKQKSKRYLIPITIGLIIVALIFGIWYYFFASPEKGEHIDKIAPHVSLGHVNITDIDGEHIKLTMNLDFANPFPINLNTKRIQYQVYIDTAMIAESSYEKPIDIASTDTTAIDIPVEASLKRLFNILKEFKKQQTDSVDYKIIAQIYLNTPIAGERQFDFTIIKRLPAFMTPEIKLVDTDIKKIGFKESGIDMAISIHNFNQFDMKIKNGHLDVLLDENIKLEGNLEDLHIPSQQSRIVSVHFKINKLGKAVWKILFNKKNTRFNFVFKAVADADNQIFHNTNLMITAHGTLGEALELVEDLK
jgi:LEA14-like dessication related protein